MTTLTPEPKTDGRRARSRAPLVLALAGLIGLACVVICLAVFLLFRGLRLREEVRDAPLVSTAGQLAFISDRDGHPEL